MCIGIATETFTGDILDLVFVDLNESFVEIGICWLNISRIKPYRYSDRLEDRPWFIK